MEQNKTLRENIKRTAILKFLIELQAIKGKELLHGRIKQI